MHHLQVKPGVVGSLDLGLDCFYIVKLGNLSFCQEIPPPIYWSVPY